MADQGFPAGDIEAAILNLLAQRKPESSICPSDAARDLYSSDTWRDHMDDVRAVANELAQRRVVRITQGDDEVDIASVKGPIRIRRGPNWQEP